MVIIGGLGSILGSILGAIFVTLLPIATRWFLESFGGLIFSQADLANIIPNLRLILFGGLIIFFLLVDGLRVVPSGAPSLCARNRAGEIECRAAGGLLRAGPQ